jgi:DNA-binding NarL/FixJ family response regulator
VAQRGANHRIRVLVGEDNYLAREGIRLALTQIDDVTPVGSCVDLPSLRESVERLHPDVVLTDVRMPPTLTDEGLQLAAELRESHPNVGVIVLSQYAQPLYAVALFEGGLDRRGYLLKDRLSSAEELGEALHQVMGGGSYLDPGLVGPILAYQEYADRRLRQLTPRELQILALVAEGLSNSAVAAAVGVPTRAVERSINSIFAKLGLSGDSDINRRVKATREYLAARQADAAAR